MSLTLIATCDDITICKTLYDECIYDCINKIVNDFDDKDKVTISLVIATDNKVITIKVK